VLWQLTFTSESGTSDAAGNGDTGPSPAPLPTIDYSVSGIGLTLPQGSNDSKCSKLKSIRKDPLGFQINHGAIGDYISEGNILTEHDICVITGSAIIPAGYYMNIEFQERALAVESYLREGDTLNFNYVLMTEVNGSEFYRRYFGRLPGPIEGISPVSLAIQNSRNMDCESVKNEDRPVNFKLSLDYQLTTKSIDPNDPVGSLLLETPSVIFDLVRCS